MLPPAQAESKTVTHTYKPFSGEFFGRVEETSDEERTTHEGGCHCGAVTKLYDENPLTNATPVYCNTQMAIS
ncbi:hypothetical protein BofuT4_uP014810.1 [Botrytis cinerea T4]|uniref:Uncharacterized protein n=1 Tax=Botryotinia fuckeliana (strain T4) TaxID=999810 RepID=G2XN97_BOTF4|nr:hypothetical protein BofuT4_uP014810.1 [Botrytis cinerea T4]